MGHWRVRSQICNIDRFRLSASPSLEVARAFIVHNTLQSGNSARGASPAEKQPNPDKSRSIISPLFAGKAKTLARNQSEPELVTAFYDLICLHTVVLCTAALSLHRFFFFSVVNLARLFECNQAEAIRRDSYLDLAFSNSFVPSEQSDFLQTFNFHRDQSPKSNDEKSDLLDWLLATSGEEDACAAGSRDDF